MKICIILRNLGVIPCEMIVEVEKDEDGLEIEEGENSVTIVPTEDERSETEVFTEFVERARSILPIKERVVDVYIGWWGNQSEFNIPQEFFDLIAETKWPVSFDIND
ncbi:MAG: hypothetical protein AAB965_03070 [Patescibacteria group bacterium]